ncbi:MAG: Legume lectin, beta domain:Protein of unknown function, partial [Armatimonadetes bacterium]|nr:Legume lectin, beta domain:Protein of unknown function [Armatimonadota bacterium]
MRFRNFTTLFCGLAALLFGAAPSHAAGQALITNGPLDPLEIQLVGAAHPGADFVSLTRTQDAFSAGALFLKQRISTRAFRADFTFRVVPTQINGDQSADGFTFAIAGSPAAVGGSGPGLGYSAIDAGGFAIEFDTFNNGSNFSDPDGNHLGLNLHGNVNSYHTQPLKIPIDDGLSHTATVTYEDTIEGGHVTVSVDGALFMTVTDPLIDVPDGYFGFTAATGALTAEHRIESFRLLTATPESTAKGEVRANAVLGSTISPKAILKGKVKVTAKAVQSGRMTLTYRTRRPTRHRIVPDSVVV